MLAPNGTRWLVSRCLPPSLSLLLTLYSLRFFRGFGGSHYCEALDFLSVLWLAPLPRLGAGTVKHALKRARHDDFKGNIVAKVLPMKKSD